MNRDETGVERDEHIHLRDRGRSRDIGLNPAFKGDRPRTRSENRTDLTTIGGYGDRNEAETTFAATAIGISAVSQIVANGAGAIKGISVCAESGPCLVRLRNGGSAGVVIWVAKLADGAFASQAFGDHGINFNGLYFEVVTGTVITGSAWIASTE